MAHIFNWTCSCTGSHMTLYVIMLLYWKSPDRKMYCATSHMLPSNNNWVSLFVIITREGTEHNYYLYPKLMFLISKLQKITGLGFYCVKTPYHDRCNLLNCFFFKIITQILDKYQSLHTCTATHPLDSWQYFISNLWYLHIIIIIIIYLLTLYNFL